MFVVSNRIPVAKGHEAAFEERFRNRFGGVEKSPGFVRNELLRPLDENGYYIVRTYWESEAAFEAWVGSESFVKAHSNRPPAEMFRGPNVMEQHELVQSTEKDVARVDS